MTVLLIRVLIIVNLEFARRRTEIWIYLNLYLALVIYQKSIYLYTQVGKSITDWPLILSYLNPRYDGI